MLPCDESDGSFFLAYYCHHRHRRHCCCRCRCCHHHFVHSLCAIYLIWFFACNGQCWQCAQCSAGTCECYLHVHFQLSGIKQGIKAHFNVIQNHRHELAQKYNYEYMFTTHTHTHIMKFYFYYVEMCENTRLECVDECMRLDVHTTESN